MHLFKEFANCSETAECWRLRLWYERPLLGVRAIAIINLEACAVGNRTAWHIQTAAAGCPIRELEESVAERNGFPLLVRAAAKLPELNRSGIGRSQVGDVPHFTLRGCGSAYYLVIAAVGSSELPFLIVLLGATSPLLHSRAVRRAVVGCIHAGVAVMVDHVVPGGAVDAVAI